MEPLLSNVEKDTNNSTKLKNINTSSKTALGIPHQQIKLNLKLFSILSVSITLQKMLKQNNPYIHCISFKILLFKTNFLCVFFCINASICFLSEVNNPKKTFLLYCMSDLDKIQM